MCFDILHKFSGEIVAFVARPLGDVSEDPGECRGVAVQQCAQLGQNLIDADLRGVSCRHADLRGQCFIGCILDDADFRGASLQGADFSGASLMRARFDDASLSGARFLNANLTRATFNRADLLTTSLIGATLSDADFCDAHLTAARFDGADCARANFYQADLSHSSWGGTRCINARFQGAIWAGVKLKSPPVQLDGFGCNVVLLGDEMFVDGQVMPIRDALNISTQEALSVGSLSWLRFLTRFRQIYPLLPADLIDTPSV
ncbi:pentapeptide repeat-containing protein [Candidatus Kirkpatrickella diaphorinae]|uniref:Pentapeptide repeat-containing protein n=1 Tax=Candidatus Kirkpatrickella diaphorinae TaxID=2984322 RepID=A0ABY6GJK9_9PROT|nr:pentapeptide repeat-containing protein [Candidatus Kirkpatrickella diaphorinae]UYH51025.1 pentapeptide repeat-containing protein [Candidatus Kirkpatrickella diaphorinae]